MASTAQTVAVGFVRAVTSVASISSAVLRLDIDKVISTIKTTIDDNKNVSREVNEMGKLLMVVEKSIKNVKVDDSAALSSMLDILNETKDTLITITKTRKKVFGYANAKGYYEKLAWERKQILECVNVLTLALASATPEQKTVGEGRFDATKFLEDTTTKQFWIKHVGLSERKISWDDFAEGFEFDFGVQDVSFMEALRDELSTGQGSSRVVTVYRLAKFSRRLPLFAACLQLGNNVYKRQYNAEGLLDRLRESVLSTLIGKKKDTESQSSETPSSMETSSVSSMSSMDKRDSAPEVKDALKGIIGTVPSLETLETTLDSLNSTLLPMAISHHLDPKETKRRSSVPKENSSTSGSSSSSSDGSNGSNGSDFQVALSMSLAAAKARKKALASNLVTNIRAVKEEVGRLTHPNDKKLKIILFFRYLLVSDFLTGEAQLPEKMKTNIGKIIRDAIKKGAPVYNSGKHKECFEIYKQTTQAVLDTKVSHECHDLCRRDECLHELNPLLIELKTALEIVDRIDKEEEGSETLGFVVKTDDWDTKAWILRRGFDFLIFNKLV